MNLLKYSHISEEIKNGFSAIFSSIRMFVFPVIMFIDLIKDLIHNKQYDGKEKFDFRKFFLSAINVNDKHIDNILKTFVKVIIKHFSEIQGKTHDTALKNFILHLREQSKVKQSMILLKTASLMALELKPKRFELSEHEADYIVQLAYTHRKLIGKNFKI